MMPDEKQIRRHDTAAKFLKALGPRWRVIVADALGIPQSSVRRYFAPPAARDDAPPPALMALAEMLATVPPEHWPDRWRRPH